MSLMKIYWVLFSSCLTTSCEASWILNSAGNYSTSFLFKGLDSLEWQDFFVASGTSAHPSGLSSPFPILPRSEGQHHLTSLAWGQWSCCGCRRRRCLNPVGGSRYEGAAWFGWGIIIRISALKGTTGWAIYWTISPASLGFILTFNLI